MLPTRVPLLPFLRQELPVVLCAMLVTIAVNLSTGPTLGLLSLVFQLWYCHRVNTLHWRNYHDAWEAYQAELRQEREETRQRETELRDRVESNMR